MKEGRCTTAAYRTEGKAAAQQRQTERLSGKNKQTNKNDMAKEKTWRDYERELKKMIK